MKKQIIVAGLSLMALAGCSLNFGQNTVSLEEAKTISQDFISTVLAPQAKIEIKNIVKSNGLFKITIDAQGQEVSSYLSPDGQIFYPQGLEIKVLKEKLAEFKAKQAEPEKQTENTDTEKAVESEEKEPSEKVEIEQVETENTEKVAE